MQYCLVWTLSSFPLLTEPDSDKQKAILREDPKAYLEYRKMIEAEIGFRFRFLMLGGPEAAQARQVSNEFRAEKGK